MSLDIATIWEAILALGALFVVVTGAMTVAPALAARYRQTTIGRRRDHYRRLHRLGTNTQLSFFNDVLGHAPAFRRSFTATYTTLAGADGDTSAHSAYLTRIALFMREVDEHESEEVTAEAEAGLAPNLAREEFELVETPISMVEVVWADRDYYVQALLDAEETVLAFAVTTRNRRFRPKFEGPSPPTRLQRSWIARATGWNQARQPLFSVRLLRSPFAAFDEPRAVYAALGFRRFNYAEAHWYGNPGSYQHYVLAYNDAGAARAWPNPQLIFGDRIGEFRTGAWSVPGHDTAADDLPRFRQETAPNTIAVVGPRFHIEDFPVSFGPDVDEVRTIT